MFRGGDLRRYRALYDVTVMTQRACDAGDVPMPWRHYGAGDGCVFCISPCIRGFMEKGRSESGQFTELIGNWSTCLNRGIAQSGHLMGPPWFIWLAEVFEHFILIFQDVAVKIIEMESGYGDQICEVKTQVS